MASGRRRCCASSIFSSSRKAFKNFRAASGEGSSCPTSSANPTSLRRCAKSSRHSPPAAFKITKLSTNVASSQPRSRSLTATCCCTLPGSPRERNACTTSGIPPRAVKVSSSGWGSTSNSNGDSVGEGFGIRRMRAIVRESHTLRVRIPEHACSLVVAAFTPIHGLQHSLPQPPGYYTSSLSTDRGYPSPVFMASDPRPYTLSLEGFFPLLELPTAPLPHRNSLPPAGRRSRPCSDRRFRPCRDLCPLLP